MIFLMNGKPRVLRASLTVTLSLLAVVGWCQSAFADAATGLLETSAGTYVFTPATCAVHREDGIDDIEIGGPGTAPGGEEFYFELSAIGNELTVNLGVNGPFASSDRKLRAGRYASREFALEVSGMTMVARNLVLVDENRDPVDDDATLTIDCSG